MTDQTTKTLDLTLYRDFCEEVAVFPQEDRQTYLDLGLIGEIGEVAGLVKKVLRDKGGRFGEEERESILYEFSDCCWYAVMKFRDTAVFKNFTIETFFTGSNVPIGQKILTSIDAMLEHRNPRTVLEEINYLAELFDSSIEEVLRMNMDKLLDRKERNVLHGSGDKR